MAQVWITLFGNLPLITVLNQTNALQLGTSQATTAYVNPTANLNLVKMILYHEEGSIAKTSVKTLLNSVDFTIFKLTLSNHVYATYTSQSHCPLPKHTEYQVHTVP